MTSPLDTGHRDTACVETWPGCHEGGYDPRCCRFPKSCSCGPVATAEAESDDDLHADLLRVMEQRNGAVTTIRMLMRTLEGIAPHIERDTTELRHAEAARDVLRIAAEWAASAEIEVME